ncbi:MAG: OmpA family protein [candidate division WOR-3 bacterium]
MINAKKHLQTTLLATLVLGMVFTLTLTGCPKKCVKPVKEEPIIVEEPTEEEIGERIEKEEVAPIAELNLQTIYFDFDKSDIRPGDAEILTSNAQKLKKALEGKRQITVTIEGHCCPIGTSEYNMALGQRRAESAKAYLVKLGVNAGILNTVSYGEERPVTTDSLQYHLNRRCEFKAVTK